MNQSERRQYLIRELLNEQPRFSDLEIPNSNLEQKRLLRSLFNIRMPEKISDDFLKVQDEYLSEILKEKGVTKLSQLSPIRKGIYVWRGDITTLEVDGIVNAANSGMTGCYQPCHSCIDNCIHTFAGIQLRLACNDLISEQGYEEPTGQAKITLAYNLPSKYVLHTVGPIVQGGLTKKHCDLLSSCYRSCLELSVEHGLKSIAFCCISTGVFMFHNEKAAEIAINTVENFKANNNCDIDVVFNVFKESDEEIYLRLLGK